MPKLKSNSSAKKRFHFTARGKITTSQANKRHNMRKRSKRQIRCQRGTTLLSKHDIATVKRYLPYGEK